MDAEFDTGGIAGDGPGDVLPSENHENMSENPENQATTCSEPDRASRWRRLLRRLFPVTRVTFPEPKWAAKDCLVVHAVTRFSWSDRLRVLVTGTVETTVKGVTEREMGRIECVAAVHPVWESDHWQ